MADPRLNLPPYPAQATPGDYIWVDWWRKLQDYMKAITETRGGQTINPGPGDSHYLVWMYDNVLGQYVSSEITGRWTITGNICTFNFLSTITVTDNPTVNSYIQCGIQAQQTMPPFPESCAFPVAIYSIPAPGALEPADISIATTGVGVSGEQPPQIALPSWSAGGSSLFLSCTGSYVIG